MDNAKEIADLRANIEAQAATIARLTSDAAIDAARKALEAYGWEFENTHYTADIRAAIVAALNAAAACRAIAGSLPD